MAEKTEPRLPDPAAQEANQAIGDLERALKHLEDEDCLKAAMQVGIAVGRLQSFVERKIAENYLRLRASDGACRQTLVKDR